MFSSSSSSTFSNTIHSYIRNRKKKIKIIFYKTIIILIFAMIILNIIYFKNENIKKKLKVCLCAIGKDENLYIKEYVEHYKNIGYNKIFLYDNNDINGEKFEDVIRKEVNEGFVSIINYRGYKRCQLQSYMNCYEKNNFKYNWLSFFDLDEFLELKPPNLCVQDFLNNSKFEKCQNIKINWVLYDNTNLYYENKPIEKRKNYKTYENKHIKSTVRGNLSTNYWNRLDNPHSSQKKFISCSCSGKIIDYKSPFNEPPDISCAFLKHYHYKSFEEFCIKLKRGKPDSFNENLNKKIKDFYEKNKYNKDKVKIMKKIFNFNLKFL